MSTFVANIFFAVIWALFFGGFTWLSVSSGLILGYTILWFLKPMGGIDPSYFRRVWKWLKMIVLFLWELIKSSVEVLSDILTPGQNSNPVMVDMPLDVKTDAGILLVTNMISLTPGTLSVDVSEDRSHVSLHVMFGSDPDAVMRDIKDGIERWVIDAVEDV